MSDSAAQRRLSVLRASTQIPSTHPLLLAVARYLQCYRCFPAVDFDALLDFFDLRGFEKSADAQKKRVIDEFLERCGYLHVVG